MTASELPGADDVLQFWFEMVTPEQRFARDAGVDAEIAGRFDRLHRAAARCELFDWRRTAEGRLAEIIVLDQFSRNLFRGEARAFAQDGLALALAQGAVAVGADAGLPAERRSFLYMPFMHSESLVIHREAMRLFAGEGLATELEYERKHLAVIERFGRYPQRNAALGRVSTAEEVAFLAAGDSVF